MNSARCPKPLGPGFILLARYGKGRGPIPRIRALLRSRKHVQLDYEFFKQPEPDAELFNRATKALNLDIAAIDYSTFADGHHILWEANPRFALAQSPLDLLGRERHTKER